MNRVVFQRAVAAALLVLVSIFININVANAQSSGVVRGTVTDAAGAAIAGVSLTLAGTSSRYSQTAHTDEHGAYRFYNVPFGDYRLDATAVGFASATNDISVRTGQPVEFPISLSPAGAHEEVTVTAGDEQIGADATANVTSATISELPISNPAKQMEGLLLNLPGIVSDENGRFHPRGAHNQASFVVDGVQVSDQMSTVFANSLDTQNVDGVSLVSGLIPPEYGNKVAAVINLSSKSGLSGGRDFFGNISIGAGSFSAWDTSIQGGGKVGEDVGIFASASYSQSRRYLDSPFQNASGYGLVAGDEGFHDNGNGQRYFTRLDWTPSESDIFKVTMSGGRSLFDVPNLPSQELAGQNQRQYIRDVAIYPSWLHVFNANWTLNVAPYYRTSNADLLSSLFDTPLQASQQRHLTSYGLNASLSYAGHGHNAKFGTDSFAFPISENFSFAITDPQFNPPDSPDYNPNLAPYDLTRGGGFFNFSQKTTGHEYSFYGQDVWTHGNLSVSGGLRFDNYHLIEVEHAWSPRFGIAYRFPTNTAVRFSYNRVFQTPSNENILLATSAQAAALIPPEQLAALGGVGVRPIPGERGNWFEAGISQRVANLMTVDVAVYAKNIDFIADDSQFLNTGVVFPVALASGTVRGLEFRANVLPQHGFSGDFSLTLSKARGLPPIVGGLLLSDEALTGITSEATEFALDHDEPVAGSFLVAWDSNEKVGVFATFEGRYDSGLPTDIGDVNEVLSNPDLAPGLALVDLGKDPIRVKPRFVLNLSAGKKLYTSENRTLSLQVSALNLTNQDRLYNFLSVFSGTHYIPPRSVAVRLGFEF